MVLTFVLSQCFIVKLFTDLLPAKILSFSLNLSLPGSKLSLPTPTDVKPIGKEKHAGKT